MNISPPGYELREEHGSSGKKSEFGNRDFGIRLANLIKNSNSGLIIGLEGTQAAMTTNFLQQWQEYLNSHECGMRNILFDADSNDYPKDSFFMIVSELYRLLANEQETVKDNFKEKTAAALGAMSKIGLRGGATAITAGALHETIYREDIDNLGDEISVATTSYVAERLDDALASRQRIRDFQDFLSSFPDLVGNTQPIVVMIDGFDRCKADFIGSMLETIRQFFVLPQFAFVVVLSRKRITNLARQLNGSGVTTAEHLHNCVDLWATLPKTQKVIRASRADYVAQCLDEMGFTGDELTAAIFAHLAQHYKLSVNEIDRSLTNLAIIENADIPEKSYGVICLSPYLAIIKVRYPAVYERISERSISLKEIEIETDLIGLVYADWEDISEPHPVRFCLNICYGDGDSDLAADLTKLNLELFGAGHAIHELIPILDSFRVALNSSTPQ
jgi:hypothetical protein